MDKVDIEQLKEIVEEGPPQLEDFNYHFSELVKAENFWEQISPDGASKEVSAKILIYYLASVLDKSLHEQALRSYRIIEDRYNELVELKKENEAVRKDRGAN